MKKKNQNTGASLVFILLLTMSGLLVGCGEKTSEKQTPKVRIGTNVWVVELATTRESRYRGLSGRREVPDGTGMLFIYPKPILLNFCMRECFIPIDIVFIGSDLRVVNTYAMQVEASHRGLASYSSGIEVQYALELPGGTVKKCGIKNGDPVELTGVVGAGQAEPG